MPASGEPHEQPSPPGELQRCVHAAGQLLRRARGRGPVVVAVWRSPKMALAATTTAGAASTTSLSDSATDSGSGRQCVSMVRCTSQADIAAAVVAEVARGSRSPRVMGRMEIRLYEAFEVEAPATLQWARALATHAGQTRALRQAALWISTLGGAYSALGDHNPDHAAKAGAMARVQLKLAIRLGDQALAARCRLFQAWAVVQTATSLGKEMDWAARTIQQVQRKGLRDRDRQLCQMAHAAAQKLSLRLRHRSSSSEMPS